MKNQTIKCVTVTFALAALFALAGCGQEVSSSSSKTTKSDGTVKTEEKTVTKSPNGTVTTEETKKSTTPTPP